MSKKKFNKEREYRSSQTFEAQDDYTVEGYAALWESYPLFNVDVVQYYEKIDKGALDVADITDVVFQFNHEGMVFARQSNGTLRVEPDDIGIKIIADLGKTEQSRQMHESIKEKMIKEMSWAFTVNKQEYDAEERTRTVKGVEKVFDVSAVTHGANSKTTINARTIDGVINMQKRSEREQELLEIRRIKAMFELQKERERGN